MGVVMLVDDRDYYTYILTYKLLKNTLPLNGLLIIRY